MSDSFRHLERVLVLNPEKADIGLPPYTYIGPSKEGPEFVTIHDSGAYEYVVPAVNVSRAQHSLAD